MDNIPETMNDAPEEKRPFSIPKRNFDKLCKKLETVRKKCEGQGRESRFEIVGEETRREITNMRDRDGNYITVDLPCYLVEVEGIATINGWKVAGSIQHTEAGNLVNKSPSFDGEIPTRYQTAPSNCNHCKGNRVRNKTVIIVNEEGEFMQVGLSCLSNYLGIDASSITSMMEIIRKGGSYGGYNISESGIDTDIALRYAGECVRKMGFRRSNMENNTASKVWYYANVENPGARRVKETREEMAKINFSPRDPAVLKMVDEALEWLNNNEDTGNYIHNLKVISRMPSVNRKQLNTLVSIFASHEMAKEWEAKRKAEAEARKAKFQAEADATNYVGEIGERITIIPESFRIVTSWESTFGLVALTKITDKDGNIYIWKSTNTIPEGSTEIKATVKEHSEYNGMRQTVITRCKAKGPHSL